MKFKEQDWETYVPKKTSNKKRADQISALDKEKLVVINRYSNK